MEPTGINKILVEKYGYEWVNGKAWRPGTAPEPEVSTIDVTPGPLPDWITAPPADAFVTQALETLTNPVTGEKFTVPTGGYTVNVSAPTPIEDTSPTPTAPVATLEPVVTPLEPLSLEEKIEQLQASLNELQKKYEEALQKLEQANERIAELEGQQGEAPVGDQSSSDLDAKPEPTPSPEPKPSKPEAPAVEAPEPAPSPSYPEPTGVNKILVEKYGYEWVNGKAWKPGTAPEVVVLEEPAVGPASEPVETRPISPNITIQYSSKISYGIYDGMAIPDARKSVYDIYEEITPNLSGLFFAERYSGSWIFFENENGTDVLSLPTWFYELPFLPAVHYKIDAENKITLHKVDASTNVPMARNWAPIKINGENAYVIADTGHEFQDREFPHGDVWIAKLDQEGEFDVVPISSVKAFYHDVEVGDINNDGLDDIIAVNMGYKDGADPYELHAFMQKKDGTFEQDIGFMSFSDGIPMLGGAAVALENIDNDPELEIVQSAYSVRDFPNWDMENLFRVWDQNENGQYELAFSGARSGKAEAVGTSGIYVTDLDLDGDNDLVFWMETGKSISDFSGTSTYHPRGIQIWENQGDLDFVNATDDWLENSIWLNSEIGGPGLEIADLNGDGYTDIFINASNGSLLDGSFDQYNFGSVIFINHEGKSFRHLKDVEELTVDIDGGPKTISKVSLAHVSDNHFDIMLINNDQTFGMVEVYHTDLNSWIA